MQRMIILTQQQKVGGHQNLSQLWMIKGKEGSNMEGQKKMPLEEIVRPKENLHCVCKLHISAFELG